MAVGKPGGNSRTNTIKKIIPTLDEVELGGFNIEDVRFSMIDYRRADKSTGTVERHGEPNDEAAPKDDFDTAWLAIKQVATAHL